MHTMRHLFLLTSLCTIFTFNGAAEKQGTALLILRHSRSTGLHYAYLQVGNKYLGRIYSGKSIRIRVLCGKAITIFFYRKNLVKKISISPTPEDTRTIILDFHKRTGYLLVYFPADGKSRKMQITINGKKMGVLDRGQKRLFRLSAGTATVILKQPGTIIRKQLLIQAGITNIYKPQ